MRFKKLLSTFDTFPHIVLFAIVGIFTLLRVPSLIEPLWYGDEGIYNVIGMAMRDGRDLYTQIWDNKPPLLYMIYALFGTELFYVKFLSLFVGACSVVIFYLLTGIFKDQKYRLISTFLFALLFGMPFLEGNIANAENFMMLSTLLSFYAAFLFRWKYKYIIAGFFLSISFLTKTVAIFDLSAMLIILLALTYKRNYHLLESIRVSTEIFIKIVLSFIFAPLIVFSYFLLKGSGIEFLRAVFLQNVNYVGVENELLFPMDILIVKLVILISIILLIFLSSKKLEKNQIIIYTWVAFSLFSTFFSQRPYTHYLLVLLPSFCLFVNYLLQNSSRRLLHIVVLIVMIVLIKSTVPYYEKTFEYYNNYFTFISNQKSLDSFRAFFDTKTVRDYDVAQLLQALDKRGPVFIWSDSGQIYSLIKELPPGKYVVAYHVLFYDKNFEETKKTFQAFKPSVIVQTEDIPENLDILSSYRLAYKIQGAKIYERQY